MTYEELKNRLSKCELSLEKIKNGTVNLSNTKDFESKKEKLQILKESLTKQIKEAEETMFVSTKGGDTKAVKMSTKNAMDLKSDPNITSIDTAKGKTIKERLKDNKGVKFSIDETKSIAKSVGKAVAISLKSLGDEVAHMKAKNIEENSFEIYVEYKNNSSDQFSFYITDDSLHLVDFSFDKEISDVGVKPSGEAVVNVDVLANELTKHFKSMNESEVNEAPEGMYYIKISKDAASQNKAQVIFNDLHDVKYELNDDPDGVIMYFKKEDFDAGIMDDLEGDGVQILDTNIPDVNEDAEEDAKNDADYAQGWHDDPRQDEDTDVGHQDDEPNMLGASAMETAEYAAKLVKKLQRYDQHDGEVDFPNWWQKKLILAREYISAAYHYLDSEEKQPAIDQLALESKVNEAMSSEQREAIYDLQNILDRAAQLGDEARQIVKDNFPNELSAGEAYDVFSFGTSSNSYDKTLETLISDIERTAEEEDMDMDEGRRDNDALYPDNPRLPNIKNLADKIVSIVKAEAAKGELGYIKTMEELRYQQEDDFERTPEWNKAKGIKSDFDDYGNTDEEYKGKHQGSNYKWPMSKATKDRKEADKVSQSQSSSLIGRLGDKTLKEWGSSDQSIFLDAMHKDAGKPKKMPSPFDSKLRAAAEDAVDFYWEDWPEYKSDREGLVDNAVRSYLRRYFKKDFEMMQKMFEPVESMNGTNEGRNVDDLYDTTISTMKRLAKKYKAGDKSVVPHLKKLTDIKKKLEQEKIKKASDIGKGQELSENEIEDAGYETDKGREAYYDVKELIQKHARRLNDDDAYTMHELLKDFFNRLLEATKDIEEAGPGFAHDCAAKVVHETYGKGNTIPEKHTLVKEGKKYVVTHYDVLFESGKTVEDIPVSELQIKTQTEHWHKGYKKKKK